MLRSLYLITALLSFGMFYTNAQLQKISFESIEGYTVGNLSGQQGWIAWGGIPVGNAQVIESNATDGARSLNVISNSLIQQPCGIEKNITNLVTSTDVEISFDYYFGAIGLSSYEIAVYNNAAVSDYTASFQINYQTGVLEYRTAAGWVDGPVLAPNQWHNLKIIIRQSNDTLQYFANGIQIFSGALGANKNVQAIDFVYDDFGSGFRVDNIQINNLASLSTNEAVKRNIIKLFPNPAVDEFQIEAEGKILLIEIFDAKGSFIKNIKETGISNGKSITVSDLETGVYIIKVKTDAGEFARKFIKK